MTQAAIGGPAQTTYRVTSRQGVSGRDAQRVFVVSDGRPQEGGPQQAVYYVSDAEIAAGDFVISGNKPIPIVEVGATGAEYPPIAVYVVTVNSESDFPPVPLPVAPQFVSAEIGNVDNTTVVVTFDMDVNAPENDFLAGVVVNVNGLLTETVSGIRQSNHAIVWYAITTPVSSGDTVTWNYNDTTGLIVSESGGVPLGDVAQASVTNNVPSADPIGDALRADAVAHYTFNEASGNPRLDSTTHHHNLSESDGTLANTAGKIGNALVVASNEAGNPILLNADTYNLQDFSIRFWFKVPSIGAPSPQSIAIELGATIDWVNVEVRPNGLHGSPGNLELCAYINSVEFPDEAYINLDANQTDWHFARVTRVSGTLSVAVDSGVPATVSGGVNLMDDSIFIGLYVVGVFDYHLDELSIFGRALTGGEDAYLYNSGAGRALFP